MTKSQKVQEKKFSEAVNLAVAVNFLKENARASFDETIELHVHLGIDLIKSDQIVRGSVVLPGGAPKSKRVVVFTADSAQKKAARDAGAVLVGGDELIDHIAKKGSLDADVAVASPDMMAGIAKIARILGPSGLMPNPKTGTVSPAPAVVVKELIAGKLSFKMDTLGNIHEAVGKASWDAEKIITNVEAVVEAIKQVRPAGMKGQLIKTMTLASTMSPGIRVAL